MPDLIAARRHFLRLPLEAARVALLAKIALDVNEAFGAVVAPSPSPPPPTGQRLSEVTARGWTEILPASTKPDTPYQLAIDSDVGNSRCMYPFTNSMPWDAVNKKIRLLGTDHTGSPYNHIDYIEATNKFVPFGGMLASHGYQHLAVNPFNSDTYMLWLGTKPGIYKHDGTEFVFLIAVPEGISQHIADAIVWWKGTIVGGGGQGALVVFTGNLGVIHVLNPLNAKWTTYGNMTPGTPGGIYQAVSAYSEKHNCMVYGGGHLYQPDKAIKKIFRMNADGTHTKMPDAPHGVGIYNGMNMVSDSRSGNIIFLGFGEHWMLDPTRVGTWAQLPKPPTMDPAAADSFVSSDTPYGVVYIERDKAKPRSTMRVWRS